MAALSLLPSKAELEGIKDLTSLQIWVGISDETWTAIADQLGALSSLKELAVLPSAELTTAMKAVQLPKTAMGNSKGVRGLTVVEQAQVDLMRRVARHKVATEEAALLASGHRAGDEANEQRTEGNRSGVETWATGRKKRQIEMALAQACDIGDLDVLQRAISEARKAGLLPEAKRAMAVQEQIIARRDAERWPQEASERLRASMGEEVDLSSLENAINRAWHAGVDEGLVTQGIAVLNRRKRQANRKSRDLLAQFDTAVQSRDRAELQLVAQAADEAGLGAEALVARDILAELDAPS